jgi:hypothetical protein
MDLFFYYDLLNEYNMNIYLSLLIVKKIIYLVLNLTFFDIRIDFLLY